MDATPWKYTLLIGLWLISGSSFSTEVRTNRARYSEAALLMGKGDFAKARQVVEGMPAEKEPKAPEEQERQRMLTYLDVLETAADENRNAYQLNAAEVQALEEMVSTHYDRPANWASNLLCAVYGKCRAPYTGDAGAPKSNRTRQRNTIEATAPARGFGIAPNPARGSVALHYDFGEADRSARAVVRDASGRVVATIALQGRKGQQVWSAEGLAPGTYTVQYISGTELLHTERLMVQR